MARSLPAFVYNNSLNMIRIACLLALLAAPLVHGAQAQSWQVFDVENSDFPSNTVVDILQDEQGIVWAATDWGLCRYESGNWTVLQVADGLPSNVLTCLSIDSDGRLWVGTVTNGIGIFDGASWIYMDQSNSPIVTEGVVDIQHDHRGWVWISTELGLHCWTGQEWRLYNNTPESYGGYQFFGSNVAGVDVREDGLVTVVTRNAGLIYLSEDDFVYYTAANANFPDNSANAVALDSNGDRWLACPSGGLIRHAGPYDDQLWFQYNMATMAFPNNTMNCIAIGSDDRKYLGTENWGILLFDSPDAWTSLDSDNSGLPDNDVRSIMIDDQGVVWAGTYLGGLARYDPATSIADLVSNVLPIRIHPNPFVDVVTVDLTGWVGPVQWKLMDALGRSLSMGELSGGSTYGLELGRRAAGTYFLQLASQESVQIGRLSAQ